MSQPRATRWRVATDASYHAPSGWAGIAGVLEAPTPGVLFAEVVQARSSLHAEEMALSVAFQHAASARWGQVQFRTDAFVAPPSRHRRRMLSQRAGWEVVQIPRELNEAANTACRAVLLAWAAGAEGRPTIVLAESQV